MKSDLDAALIVIVLLLLVLTAWDIPMSAMGTVQQPVPRPTAQRPGQRGADQATRIARDPSRVILQITVRSEADRQAARSLGTMIEDYGSSLVVAATAETARLASQNSTFELATLETTIELRGFRFDPLTDDPARAFRAEGGYRESSEGGGDYYIVQFVAPARDEWLDEVRAAGGEVLQYVPNQGFFVYAISDSINIIRQHPRVRWVGAFHPAYKLAPELRERVYGNQTQRPIRIDNTAEPISYDIGIFKQADIDLLSARLSAMAATVRHRIILPNNYFNVLQVTLDPAVIKQIAQLPGVISIDPYYQPQKEDERAAQVVAGNYSSVTSLNPPGYNPLAQFGVDGTNVTVAVDDDGVGIPGDGGFYISAGNAVNGPLRGATVGAEGHGHLNATIIAGDSPFSTLDPFGYNYGLGIARKAHIVNIPGLRAGYTGTFADRANDAVTTAGPNGVTCFISNNSWGASTNGNAYDSLAAQYDGFARDASAAPTVDPLLFIFSAGNSGQSGLTRPKASKNTIAVANAENIRTELSATANNIDEMAISSSRGPTADGRIKPDITAPGTAITGGRSGPDAMGGNIDAAHRWSTGTSHSAPQIAGAAALFTQFWKINNSGVNPSPAIVKAALINGVREMNGSGATGPIPNGDEGWGRLNLQNVLNTGTPIRYVNQTISLANVGDVATLTGTVATESKHFRATLVWTDPPGVSDPALVNNLDLEVVVGGTLYKGNRFISGQSVTGGAADTRNNVENVFLPSGIPAGTRVSIRVRATTLNGDGILGNADLTDQHFALVAFNFSEAAVAAVAGLSGTLASESCSPLNNAIDPGETVTVSFSLQNLGAVSTANLVATLQATGGVTSPSSPQNYGALTAGGPVVTRPFTFTAGGICGDNLTATLSLQDGATNLGTATFTFTLGTTGTTSTTFSYTGPPAAIPDGSVAGVNIPLTVSGFTGHIADLNFRIDGTGCDANAGSTTVGVGHTWIGDLTFRLTSPAGTTVTFINRPGGVNNDGNNFCQLLLDDDAGAAPSIGSITATGTPPLGPPYTGTFKPQSPFSVFDGEDANGTWILSVNDAVPVDSGSIRAFSLIITGYNCCSGTCPTITVNPPTIPSGVTGVAYNQTFTASGGTTPHTFSVIAGALPPGLTLSSSGLLSGTPTQTGNSTFTVRAMDAGGCTGTREYTLSISGGCAGPTIQVDDGSFELSIGYETGTTSYFVNRLTPGSYPATISSLSIYFADFSNLPPGASFALVVGTNPDGDGNINNTAFQSTNATVQSFNQFNLYDVPDVTINSGDFVVGIRFTPATGVFPAALDQTLPRFQRSYASNDGLNFALTDSFGPNLAGNFGIRAILTQCSVPNCPIISNVSPGSGPPGTQVIITGSNFTGVSGVRFAGNINAQFTVNSDTQIITTVPAGSTAGPIIISKPGCPDSQTSTFIVCNGATLLSVDDGTFEASFQALGGSSSYYINRLTPCGYPATLSQLQIFFPNGGNLPVGTGITLLVGTNPDGDTNINNTVFQTTSATVQALGQFITYQVPSVAITSGDFVIGFRLTHSNQVFPAAHDNNSPLHRRSYSSVNGTTFSLLEGLIAGNLGIRGSLSSCPGVSGITPTSGSVGSTVTINGANLTGVTSVRFANNVPATFSVINSTQITTTVPAGAVTGPITISKPGCPDTTTPVFNLCATITLNPPLLPSGTINVPYNQTITQTGGASPVAFSISSGALPPGLSFDSSTGLISGTPTQSGDFTFKVKATGANGCFGERSYTLGIIGAGFTGLQYYPLPAPIRLLDTRPGESACFAPNAPLGNDAVRLQQAIGACSGIPANAKAIIGNATVVNFISSGFHWITLYPSDAPRPNASNLNFSDNQVVPNSFTVGLGADGGFKIYSHASTHFIVDITGYYAPPGQGGLYFHPLPAPLRLLDTRPGETACDAPNTALADDGTRTVTAHRTCLGATIPASARAIVGNATVVNFISSGLHWITLYPFGASLPNASNLNFAANQIVPNAFVVGLSNDGKFNIYSHASTHFIVDVAGYFSEEAVDVNGQGLAFNTLPTPVRLLDTRPGEQGCDAPGLPLGNDATLTQQAQRTCFGVTIPNTAKAVVGNGTVVNFISSGFHWITFYPFGAAQPNASNLNFTANQIVPNAFVVGLSDDGKFNLYSHASTHFIVDLTGFFAP
jgi:hypothetical protein